MPVQITSTPKKITALLTGEIDHHNSAVIREIIDQAVRKQQPQLLIMDFGGVTFMDSSGVGLVMGRYRTVQNYGGKIEVANLSKQYYRVMRLSGIERLAKISVREAVDK
ncbi:MAG: anti-sigma factor antagonist [Clostridiales bacterium]|nr:anti-sigma factor antagonist [Clostridiales bacterium]